MTTTVLDPTSELRPAQRERVARPESLAGLTVGLLDISKPRGNVFLSRVEERLVALGATVNRYTQNYERYATQMINRMDTNKNGYIEKKEVEDQRTLQALLFDYVLQNGFSVVDRHT